MSEEREIVERLRVDASGASREVEKAAQQERQVGNRVEQLKRKLQDQRRRMLQMESEARRQQTLFGGAAPGFKQFGVGFGNQAIKRMMQGARGAIFTMAAAEAFEGVFGGPSPLQSAITGGLSGLVTGGPGLAAIGLVSGVVTGLIGEVRALDQKVKAAHTLIDKGLKDRREKEHEFERKLLEETRLREQRIKELEKKFERITRDRIGQANRLLEQFRGVA